ncbi:uncharacterized protein SAPINGB_P003546 [Magnusiomyces paraingens]|uniref:Transmembrane protein 135 N-terminal domain-containing protein n=1 Tax=Magnusiomyces paraingens TaxID=2606893 RepID=A0A5E8BPV8_9ASCO|nr:uncharacterized protein SAPINGB_P003546 [Saprochaete ingens]VVT53383.1 unnamed protein product [Saprochaete ingens]
MASSENSNSTDKPGPLETTSASLVGFLFSPEEYLKIYDTITFKKHAEITFKSELETAPTTTSKIKVSAKEVARLLFPRPVVVIKENQYIDPTDEDKLDPLSPYPISTNTNIRSLRTFKKTIRGHTRVLGKAYIILVIFKSLALLRSRKKNALLRSVLVLKDKGSFCSSLAIVAISFSYKIIYEVLVILKPFVKDFIGLFIHDKSILSELLFEYAHTIIPLLSGITAGTFLKIFPADGPRDLIAVYALVRSLELVYNFLEDSGYIAALKKPKIIGSWALFPFAYAQLFHAFFFNRDANPNMVNSTLFLLSKDFCTSPPTGYPRKAPWPTQAQLVDSIAKLSRAHYPKFTSPLMFPDTATLPNYLESVKPVVIRAHPAISTITGALLHPSEPSQFRALANIVLKQYTAIGKYVFLLYLFKSFFIKRAVAKVEPKSNKEEFCDSEESTSSRAISQLRLLLATIFNTWRTTTFIVMTTASSWAGIEFAQSILSNRFIPVYRYKVIGFLSGLWAIFDKVSGRGRYMYAVRAAILSYWRVLVKEKRVRPVRNGDVYIFALSFGVIMSLFELSPGSVSGPVVRKVLSWISTGTFSDPLNKTAVSLTDAKSKDNDDDNNNDE